MSYSTDPSRDADRYYTSMDALHAAQDAVIQDWYDRFMEWVQNPDQGIDVLNPINDYNKPAFVVEDPGYFGGTKLVRAKRQPTAVDLVCDITAEGMTDISDTDVARLLIAAAHGQDVRADAKALLGRIAQAWAELQASES